MRNQIVAESQTDYSAVACLSECDIRGSMSQEETRISLRSVRATNHELRD